MILNSVSIFEAFGSSLSKRNQGILNSIVITKYLLHVLSIPMLLYRIDDLVVTRQVLDYVVMSSLLI